MQAQYFRELLSYNGVPLMSKVIPSVQPNSTIYKYVEFDDSWVVKREDNNYATRLKCKNIFIEIFPLIICMQLLTEKLTTIMLLN